MTTAPLRVLIVTAMYPDPAHPVRGIAVKREHDRLVAAGCGVVVVAKSARAGWRPYWALWRRARSAVRAGDFHLVHGHYGTAAFVAALLRRRPPLVSTLHGSDIAHGMRPGPSKLWVQYVLSTAAASVSRVVLVQDAAMREALPSRLRQRTTVLSQGVDPRRLPDVSEGRVPRRIVFLSDKVRTVKRYPLARAATDLLTPAAELRALDDVTPDAVPELLASGSCALLTSEREGMPIAVLEALAAGLPVVCVELPSTERLARAFPELVRLCEDRPEALAVGLEDMLSEAPAVSRAERLRRLDELGLTEPGRTERLLEHYRKVVSP